MNLRDKLNFCAKSESRQVMFDQAEARLLLAALELAEKARNADEYDNDYGIYLYCPWCGATSAYQNHEPVDELKVEHRPGCEHAAFRAAKEALEQGAKP